MNQPMQEFNRLPIFTDTELDYQRLMKAGRRVKLGESAAVVKLALLADCATQQLATLLKALLAEAGLRAEIYEGGFDAIEIETRASDSGLYRFGPDVVVVLQCAQALRAAYSHQPAEGSYFIADQVARVVGTWDAIQSRCTAMILQSTFAIPAESHFGNFDLKVPTSLRSSAISLNAGVEAAARDRRGVLMHDVEAVASWIGRRHFFDDRAWDMWKAPCSLEHLPKIAKNIADVVLAARGRVVKCVISDLDNTLWGGIIGDDGLDGIALGGHDAGVGESFVRLQSFLKQLRRRGVLLAVCSKNDEATALLPFLHHPDMVLKRDDISVFVANWNDKAAGIRRIRDELNIGLDSMVFLDDNPFERNLVRELLPEVIVPELPEDPSTVVAFLSQLNLFETTSFSGEDLQRAERYQREAQRRNAAAGCASVQDYLRSLDMQMVLSRFDRFQLPRIAQLMQRSNQFNLRTRRLTETECETLMQDDRFLPLYATLADRFGDHGLIAVAVIERGGEDLIIRDWLMSCRVLTRGVEQLMMNHVAAEAVRLSSRRVIGEYIPSPKNAMVRDFYSQFGFVRSSAAGNEWVLDAAAYRPQETFIQLVQSPTAAQGTEGL
jgi:FkbH-like protein